VKSTEKPARCTEKPAGIPKFRNFEFENSFRSKLPENREISAGIPFPVVTEIFFKNENVNPGAGGAGPCVVVLRPLYRTTARLARKTMTIALAPVGVPTRANLPPFPRASVPLLGGGRVGNKKVPKGSACGLG